jgi:hypothetical protein
VYVCVCVRESVCVVCDCLSGSKFKMVEKKYRGKMMFLEKSTKNEFLCVCVCVCVRVCVGE